MNQPPTQDADTLALEAAGALAYVGASLDEIEERLGAAPHWRPGRSLLAEAAECRARLEGIEAAWGRRLVVALVGPSGAGKSTLLNALAGKELSPTGRTRPTTREVVVYARERADAEDLIRQVGEDRVRVVTDEDARVLDYLLLVDAPDTNTLPENQRLLERVLDRADLMLTVFPAQNPRMHDNVAFLRPYVERMPPNAVVPVLNMVDRAPLGELQGSVLDDVRRMLGREWELRPDRIYLVSAKASLPGAHFAEDETPLHALNQFDALRAWLLSSLGRAGQATGQRLARAERLLDVLRAHSYGALEETRAAREGAEKALHALGLAARRTMEEAALASSTEESSLQRHAALYSALGHAWWGPVGWLVAIWSLALRLIAFLARPARPLPLLPSLNPAGSPDEAAPQHEAVFSAWSERLSRDYTVGWPPASDALVRAGFDASVRSATLWQSWLPQRLQDLAQHWAAARDDRTQTLAQRLSAWPLQLVLNAPVAGMLGWVGYETIASFFQRSYLPGDYFRHAGIALVVVWLLSFILLQVVVSTTLRAGLGRRAVRELAGSAGDWSGPLEGELAALRDLQRLCEP